MATSDYIRPGGVKLFFQTGSTGYRDLGNIITPDIESAIETLDHFTNRSGRRERDRSVVTSTSMAVNFSFDEFNPENLRLAFMANAPSDVTAGDVQIDDEVLTLTGTQASTLALDASDTAPVVKSLDGITTYVDTTDYTFDAAANTITRVDTGSITDGEQVKVTYQWDAPSHSTVGPMTSSTIEGQARLLIQPTGGRSLIWTIPKAELRPNGSLSINDEEWMAQGMQLTVLSDTDNNPSAPFGTLRTASA